MILDNTFLEDELQKELDEISEFNEDQFDENHDIEGFKIEEPYKSNFDLSFFDEKFRIFNEIINDDEIYSETIKTDPKSEIEIVNEIETKDDGEELDSSLLTNEEDINFVSKIISAYKDINVNEMNRIEAETLYRNSYKKESTSDDKCVTSITSVNINDKMNMQNLELENEMQAYLNELELQNKETLKLLNERVENELIHLKNKLNSENSLLFSFHDKYAKIIQKYYRGYKTRSKFKPVLMAKFAALKDQKRLNEIELLKNTLKEKEEIREMKNIELRKLNVNQSTVQKRDLLNSSILYDSSIPTPDGSPKKDINISIKNMDLLDNKSNSVNVKNIKSSSSSENDIKFSSSCKNNKIYSSSSERNIESSSPCKIENKFDSSRENDIVFDFSSEKNIKSSFLSENDSKNFAASNETLRSDNDVIQTKLLNSKDDIQREKSKEDYLLTNESNNYNLPLNDINKNVEEFDGVKCQLIENQSAIKIADNINSDDLVINLNVKNIQSSSKSKDDVNDGNSKIIKLQKAANISMGKEDNSSENHKGPLNDSIKWDKYINMNLIFFKNDIDSFKINSNNENLINNNKEIDNLEAKIMKIDNGNDTIKTIEEFTESLKIENKILNKIDSPTLNKLCKSKDTKKKKVPTATLR